MAGRHRAPFSCPLRIVGGVLFCLDKNLGKIRILAVFYRSHEICDAIQAGTSIQGRQERPGTAIETHGPGKGSCDAGRQLTSNVKVSRTMKILCGAQSRSSGAPSGWRRKGLQTGSGSRWIPSAYLHGQLILLPQNSTDFFWGDWPTAKAFVDRAEEKS